MPQPYRLTKLKQKPLGGENFDVSVRDLSIHVIARWLSDHASVADFVLTNISSYHFDLTSGVLTFLAQKSLL